MWKQFGSENWKPRWPDNFQGKLKIERLSVVPRPPNVCAFVDATELSASLLLVPPMFFWKGQVSKASISELNPHSVRGSKTYFLYGWT